MLIPYKFSEEKMNKIDVIFNEIKRLIPEFQAETDPDKRMQLLYVIAKLGNTVNMEAINILNKEKKNENAGSKTPRN